MFYILSIPVLSLLVHNIIPHEHHTSCPEHQQNSVQEVNIDGINNCCSHHQNNHSPQHKKASCILTSLLPVFFYLQVFAKANIFEFNYQIDTEQIALFIIQDEEIPQQEYFYHITLRGPPSKLI